MARTFDSVSLADFPPVVAAFPWTRRIAEVHLHHTWRPRQVDYVGHSTIVAMWRHHTETNGWSDIGQHVTIAPDGVIWLCRNFNRPPASARGFNGNENAGPFMIEMIGDFDVGKETPRQAQWQATLGVIKAVQEKFDLKPSDLRFHNEMSSKSCPGTSIDKGQLIKEIKEFEPTGRGAGRARGQDGPLFPPSASRALDVVRTMAARAGHGEDMSAAEHEVGLGVVEARSRARGDRFGGSGITWDMIEELGDHVINLSRGRFSESGQISTSESDVDRIFTEVLPGEIRRRTQEKKQKARLLFYSHGGLVSESNALYMAYQQLEFWRENGIYPVFFIWETSLAETIRQSLADIASRIGGTRGFLSAVTDELIEEAVRTLQVGRAWDAMKSSAEAASGSGGALYTARRAAELLARHPGEVEIHTVGHSAGAIFNAHFMGALVEADARVATAHFLAPAIRSDVFHHLVAPRLGQGIDSLTVFTMTKALERADNVATVYRKSLLYLVHEALEDRRGEPILGLEASLRADAAAAAIFGLSGRPAGRGNVVWSRSDDLASGGASQATSHGGFDNDPATMTSVVRRVLGRLAGEPVTPFPVGTRGWSGDFWSDQVDWPEPLADLLAATGGPAAGSSGPAPSGAPPTPPPASPATGRRLALCIGIDRYPRMPLQGCVADARLWAETLAGLGYKTTMLTDDAATAAAIRDSIARLVGEARAGDSIVVQYAGHGTQFTDTDGDEAGGDTPALDECLCAVDCEGSGTDGLVIDDELKAVFDRLAADVRLTVFLDSCHSGSATRAALRTAASTRSRGEVVRVRYLEPSPMMARAYATRLSQLKSSRSAGSTVQKDILFSACASNELAYESGGQGDFTLRATGRIRAASGMTNRDFLEAVLAAFGSGARQTPQLHCDAPARGARFLGL